MRFMAVEWNWIAVSKQQKSKFIWKEFNHHAHRTSHIYFGHVSTKSMLWINEIMIFVKLIPESFFFFSFLNFYFSRILGMFFRLIRSICTSNRHFSSSPFAAYQTTETTKKPISFLFTMVGTRLPTINCRSYIRNPSNQRIKIRFVHGCVRSKSENKSKRLNNLFRYGTDWKCGVWLVYVSVWNSARRLNKFVEWKIMCQLNSIELNDMKPTNE